MKTLKLTDQELAEIESRVQKPQYPWDEYGGPWPKDLQQTHDDRRRLLEHIKALGA